MIPTIDTLQPRDPGGIDTETSKKGAPDDSRGRKTPPLMARLKTLDSLQGSRIIPMVAMVVAAFDTWRWLRFHGLWSANMDIFQQIARRSRPYDDGHADFPPLKFGIIWGLEQLHLWRAVPFILSMTTAYLAAKFLLAQFPGDRLAWLLGILPFALPSYFLSSWIFPWDDKAVYVVGLLAIWLLRDAHPAIVGAAAALLQGYGGSGLLMLPILLRTSRNRLALVASFAVVFALPHAILWPDSLHGYILRSQRMHSSAPSFSAIWLLLPGYEPWMPTAFMAGGYLVTLALWRIGRLEDLVAIGWAGFWTLAGGPEPPLARILASWVALFLLTAGRPWLAGLLLVQMALVSAVVFGFSSKPTLVLLIWSGPALVLASGLRSRVSTRHVVETPGAVPAQSVS